jgi:hypothetical protein
MYDVNQNMPTEQEQIDSNKRVRLAVLDLRNRLGLTQTQFGGRIGKGLASVQRYENLVPPSGAALVQLMTLAAEIKEASLAEVFRSALSKELGYDVPLPRLGTDPYFTVEEGEQAEIDTLIEILRNPELADERRLWDQFSAALKAERAQAALLGHRSDSIFSTDADLTAKMAALRERGVDHRAMTIHSVEGLRKFISELKREGKSRDEIVSFIGLEDVILLEEPTAAGASPATPKKKPTKSKKKRGK